MASSAEVIFDKFLRRMHGNLLELPTRTLHRIFYLASLKHPTEMSSFQFLLRTEPYSPTIAQLVWEFQQGNQLGRSNPDYTGYILKIEGDPMPSPSTPEDDRVVETIVTILEQHKSAKNN